MENFWDFSVWGTFLIIGVLLSSLLAGNILRRKIPFLRDSLIPTSVLGGMLLLFALALAQLLCVAISRTNSAIHDLMAGTVVVDIASQTVFRDTEELIAYTKRIHAQRAARQQY